MSKEIKPAEVLSIGKNILGTLSINMKIKGMRKPQEFVVYPITKETKVLHIQSDTRFGRVNLNGKGEMSRPHANGAYAVHLAMDKLVPFEFSKADWKQIVEYIGLTEGDSVGDSIVKSNNSGAKSIFGLD